MMVMNGPTSIKHRSSVSATVQQVEKTNMMTVEVGSACCHRMICGCGYKGPCTIDVLGFIIGYISVYSSSTARLGQ